jgi:hypothetical protein
MLKTKFLSLTTFLALVRSAVAKDDPEFKAQLNITNNCPITIPIWLAGQPLVNLTTKHDHPHKSFYLHEYENNDVGYFYTDANGGNGEDGNGTLRVDFFTDRYWLIKDPQWINIGMTVTPNHKPHNGYCVPARCVYNDCDDNHAFPTPPPSKRSVEFAALTGTPTKPSNQFEKRAEFDPPVYSCPEATKFTVTFCPDGKIPNPAN